MGKGKLAKFADMETYENVFQYPYSVIDNVPFEMRGHWREQYFHNDHPIVLELGCGKGEYTVELAKLYPDVNFIGVDIKGARMWTGATQALKEGLKNVAFLRTNIEIIERFFAEDEVQEIWLTFSDPQMKNPRKRLTSTYFMERYRKFLVDGGIIHLKTDSNFLFTYTTYMVEHNALPLLFRTEDLYGDHQCSARPKDACYQRDARMVNGPLAQRALATNGTQEWSMVNGQWSMFNAELLSIQTYYESMWIARGLNIKYMKWQLPRNVALEEPDVEIELDDYRSYHRTKRSSLNKAK